MSSKCPKLQKLVCNAELLYKQKADKSKQVVYLGILLLFTELQELQMSNMVVNNFRLEMLADRLPKLRYIVTTPIIYIFFIILVKYFRVLNVALGSKVSASGIAVLAKLEHLQEFLFV